jgi:chemotaxis protein methyltransferase CheR
LSQLVGDEERAWFPNRSITDAEFHLFRELFHETIGMHLSLQKKPLVAVRLGRRLEELNLPSFGRYFHILRDPSRGDEMQRAVDLITTNETSFFRENTHFQILSEKILPAMESERKVKVWCAASSSGEEPYTLAMVLSDCRGLDGWTLLATDINTEVLATATKGLYPMARAKGIPEHFLKAYCLKGTGPYHGEFLIDSSLRSRVEFRQMNLMAMDPEAIDFDIVFIRNVLIYFDQATRIRVLSGILSRLRPDGWLILGHSESIVGLGLPPMEQVAPSVYRKTSTKDSFWRGR